MRNCVLKVLFDKWNNNNYKNINQNKGHYHQLNVKIIKFNKKLQNLILNNFLSLYYLKEKIKDKIKYCKIKSNYLLILNQKE